jgi:hypothetical protein
MEPAAKASSACRRIKGKSSYWILSNTSGAELPLRLNGTLH